LRCDGGCRVQVEVLTSRLAGVTSQLEEALQRKTELEATSSTLAAKLEEQVCAAPLPPLL
jgi:hypothetical protein